MTGVTAAVPVIEAVSLVKRYGPLTVLDRVTIPVAAGTAQVIIGPSGSGKSTVLRCLCGLEPFDGGEVRIDGRPALRPPPPERWFRPRPRPSPPGRRGEIGMIFQRFNLFPHKTALDNVALAPMRVQGIGRDEARARAAAELARVGLAEKEDAFPHTLSGGQQQRVAIARALAMQPRVLLFDEVTSALDPELVGDVLQVMRQLRADGMTMVVVTHEMQFASEIATRVAFMDAGGVVEEGPPAEVLKDPAQPRTREFLRRILKR